MNSNLFQPDANGTNLYLKIGGKVLGPVTKQEALQLLKQDIVCKKDMVAKDKEGPWLEIGESNFILEMILPPFEATPPLPPPLVVQGKEVIKSPFPRLEPPVPTGKQLAAKPLFYPNSQVFIVPTKAAPLSSLWYFIYGVLALLVIAAVGVWFFNLTMGGISNLPSEFPNKNYAEEWKKGPQLDNYFPNNSLRSISVWNSNSIFVSTQRTIHHWNGKAWKLLHTFPNSSYHSKITAIGPNQVVSVTEENNKGQWVICNTAKATEPILFGVENPFRGHDISDDEPLIGKNGEYIFPTFTGVYYYQGKETKLVEGKDVKLLKINASDPIFAKFVLDKTNNNAHLCLFKSEALGICAISNGSTVSVFGQKDGSQPSYQMVGNRSIAWKGWAHSPTNFWILCKDGIVLKSNEGQLILNTNPLPGQQLFVDVNWDKKTGTVYGITGNQIWTLDEYKEFTLPEDS